MVYTVGVQDFKEKTLKEIYLLDKAGLPVYHKQYLQDKTDSSLFSGFISAIFTFSEQITGGQIKTMEMGNSKFLYQTVDQNILVLHIDKDTPELFSKIVVKNIVSIIEKFKHIFNDVINVTSIEPIITPGVDQAINSAIEEYFSKYSQDSVGTLEKFLGSIFGSMGKQILDMAIKNVFDLRSNFREDRCQELIEAISILFAGKVPGSQINQIRQEMAKICHISN